MVKVLSTARRADAVRCIGCGINGQLQRGYSCRAQMAMTFNCHGPQGSGSRLDRTAIFLKIGGSALDRTDKISCFDVIILTASNMLVVIFILQIC